MPLVCSTVYSPCAMFGTLGVSSPDPAEDKLFLVDFGCVACRLYRQLAAENMSYVSISIPVVWNTPAARVQVGGNAHS